MAFKRVHPSDFDCTLCTPWECSNIVDCIVLRHEEIAGVIHLEYGEYVCRFHPWVKYEEFDRIFEGYERYSDTALGVVKSSSLEELYELLIEGHMS